MPGFDTWRVRIKGCISAVDTRRRTIFAVDAHRSGKRFVVRADEKLTAFMELESAIRDAKRQRIAATPERFSNFLPNFARQFSEKDVEEVHQLIAAR